MFLDDLHFLDIKKVIEKFQTTEKGLSSSEVLKRQKLYGKNTLEDKKTSIFFLFLSQFNNVLIYVLLLASVISLISNRYVDFWAIITMVFINGLIGFVQELKAKSSIEALKKLTELKCKVLRDNKIEQVLASDLVIGDIVLLSEGDVVSADIRLLESTSLMVDESMITGEALPVIKDFKAKSEKEALPFEMQNILFNGTSVVKGFAKGLVIRCARNTYFANILKDTKTKVKNIFTKAIETFSRRYLSLLVVLFCILGVVGYLQGRSWLDLTYILIAELISALPEGLPIVVTTVLVIGAIYLSKRKTLVRYLPAVQTLGSTTVIASDKTGTITENKLIVKEFFPLMKIF